MSHSDLSVEDVSEESRYKLEHLLEESFTGMCLWHSKRTLERIEVVKKAVLGGNDVGLAMLRMMEPDLGYLYYIAVARAYRGRGVGGFLLDKSLEYFNEQDANEVLAAIEEDNVESKRLFHSRGFQEVSYSDISKKYGRIRTANIWRKMLVVYGEIVLGKNLAPKLIE